MELYGKLLKFAATMKFNDMAFPGKVKKNT
jgi:hypothetical protein